MKKIIMIVLVLALALTVMVSASAESDMAARIAEINHDASITTTTVIMDATSPTGAYATFRYPASEGLVRVAVGCDEMTYANETATDIAPEDWTKGSWIYSNVRTSTARDMELVGDYWVATWPVVNGSVLYYFYLGETGDEYVTAETTYDFAEAAIKADKQCWDPQNEPSIAPWDTQKSFAANQRRSLIYVPRAEGFTDEDMTDFSIQDPNGTDQKGTLEYVQIPGIIKEEEVKITCTVYLPYGYDATRAEAYPLHVLYHGAGGDYTQWTEHGAADHIYDNAIAQGIVEPTVVVIPDGTQSGFDINFPVEYILPYMQSNYNCTTDVNKLALSGLSAGGMLTGNVLAATPTIFKYYGGFSCFGRTSNNDYNIDLDNPVLKTVKLYASHGDNDYTSGMCDTAIAKLSTNPEIDLTAETLHGAHQMYYWRHALENFLSVILWK